MAIEVTAVLHADRTFSMTGSLSSFLDTLKVRRYR